MSDETRLAQEYTRIYRATGFNASEAPALARSMIARAKGIVTQRGLDREPRNRGDSVLAQVSTDEQIGRDIEVLKADGVTDADIRWWWNMPPLERVMIELTDDAERLTTYIAFQKQGLSVDDAAARVKKLHPICGNHQQGSGDDRPLPLELKHRIVEFIEKNAKNPTALKEMLEKATSFNAIFRQAMRQGQIPPGSYQTSASQRQTGCMMTVVVVMAVFIASWLLL